MLFVPYRTVERMQGGAHQSGGGVHEQPGVRVQGQQIAAAAQRLQIALKGEKAVFAASDDTHQFGDGAALAFPAGILAHGFAVFPPAHRQHQSGRLSCSGQAVVEAADFPLESGDVRGVSGQGGKFRAPQIGQQADLDRSLTVGIVQLGQSFRRLAGLVGRGKQRGHGDDGAPLLRNDTFQL